MLENKRIEMLEKRCKALQEDNRMLNKRCEELQAENKNMHDLVEAANTYTEEHRKSMILLNESRARYDLAYKQMMKLKKEYKTRMENVLKGFE